MKKVFRLFLTIITLLITYSLFADTAQANHRRSIHRAVVVRERVNVLVVPSYGYRCEIPPLIAQPAVDPCYCGQTGLAAFSINGRTFATEASFLQEFALRPTFVFATFRGRTFTRHSDLVAFIGTSRFNDTVAVARVSGRRGGVVAQAQVNGRGRAVARVGRNGKATAKVRGGR